MKDFLDTLYDHQLKLQQFILGKQDVTSIVDMYGAATGAIIEIGEMLQSDTRWKRYITKSKKKSHFNLKKFTEEYADVIIYMMNVAIYAGIDVETIKNAIYTKLGINLKRFNYEDNN